MFSDEHPICRRGIYLISFSSRSNCTPEKNVFFKRIQQNISYQTHLFKLIFSAQGKMWKQLFFVIRRHKFLKTKFYFIKFISYLFVHSAIFFIYSFFGNNCISYLFLQEENDKDLVQVGYNKPGHLFYKITFCLWFDQSKCSYIKYTYQAPL